jgi:hypothetical protein
MKLEDVGVWISPSGEVIDVYGSDYLTHDGWAMAHGRSSEDMIANGWVSVSQGEYFNFRGDAMDRVRAFVRARPKLYGGRQITISQGEQDRELNVEELLDD